MLAVECARTSRSPDPARAPACASVVSLPSERAPLLLQSQSATRPQRLGDVVALGTPKARSEPLALTRVAVARFSAPPQTCTFVKIRDALILRRQEESIITQVRGALSLSEFLLNDPQLLYLWVGPQKATTFLFNVNNKNNNLSLAA